MVEKVFALSFILFICCYSFADEYLIPEDWETSKRPVNIELSITLNDLNNGMNKYLKTIPQCKDARLDKPKLINDGKNAYQEITLGMSSISIISDIASSRKLTNIKFTSTGNIKNDNDMRAMLCTTYSVMRTLQPEYETQKGALDSAGRLWVLSKDKPFEMSYFIDRLKAQHVPFELNVYTKN